MLTWFWASFSIYALLFSSHCVYVLDMYPFFISCTLLITCLDDNLLCYVIIVVISIWLICVWSSCSFVSHYVYLIEFFLYFILVLYYLLYFEGLMYLVQVFYDTSIFSKFIIGFRFRCEWVLLVFPNSCLSVESVLITSFGFRCKWVLPVFPNSCLSVESVIGCFVTE